MSVACAKCGAEVPAGVQFCSVCGTATNAAATTTIAVIRATGDRAPRHPVNADEPGRSASLFPLIMVIPTLGPAPHRSLTVRARPPPRARSTP